MVDLSVNLAGVQLSNPVIPASGTFGFCEEFRELYDVNMLGAVSIKGTTLNPRLGNPVPRIAECAEGLINSVGLQNPGVDVVAGEIVPALREWYHKPIIANISGFSLEEYAETARRIAPVADIIEVNVSCPNVHGGGISFGTDPASAAKVTEVVKAACDKPVFVKLTPNVTDITTIAKACESAGADGLCLINTLLGMRIDIRRGKPVIAAKMGGFSGPAVKPVAVRMVYQVAEACSVPVIGCGGVSSAEDVIEMMMAGATAVEVGSANLVNPFACKEIIEDLPRIMQELGINSLSEIIGKAHQI